MSQFIITTFKFGGNVGLIKVLYKRAYVVVEWIGKERWITLARNHGNGWASAAGLPVEDYDVKEAGGGYRV